MGCCCIKDCSRTIFAKGLCQTHYLWARRGKNLSDPVQRQYHGLTVEDRLKRRVEIDPLTQCWLWTGSLSGKGYGQFRVDSSRPQLAHRVSYGLFVGPPGDSFVLHRCDTPRCINPEHLFLGTQADNVADMQSKGRARKRGIPGEANCQAKLTEASVRSIRLSHASDADLAKQYGVGSSTVRDARHRKTWAHVA